MKKLAIKGHNTRYREVIEVLKMLGGKDVGYAGQCYTYYYYINDRSSSIEGTTKINKDNEYKIFTLEEFLEKYPFKVGDIVDRNIDYVSCIIDDMRWNSEKCCVEYHLNYLNSGEYGWHVVECLIKPENLIAEFMQKGKTEAVIFNDANYENEVELQLGDYEIKVRDGRTFAVKKKPKYPTTFEECLNMLYCKSSLRTIIGHRAELLFNLEKLLICRDAYWKIMGEQMGLGKLWEPQFESCKTPHYCIFINYNGEVRKDCFYGNRCILAFPTAEMRDAFYENFKDLIEQCKELL